MLSSSSKKQHYLPLAGALALAIVVRIFILSVYKIPSDSMAPTFLSGDFIMATKTSFGLRFPWNQKILFPSQPEKGDLVIVSFKEKPTISYVRRVMGLPGEKVDLNGQLITLKENEFFVLSDNADSKEDSRFLGPVPLDQIESKAKLIWFSVGPEKTIRWSRIFSLL